MAAQPGRAQSAPATFKVAFFNIQSGKGEPALPGHPVEFFDTTNCTDATKPINAWGIGLIQKHLRASIAADPKVVALGMAEAWTCGAAENVQQVLGWAARTTERNGVVMLARYGFAGPEEWMQLDTSLNQRPSDTMWVLREPVCLDAACTQNVNVFAGHWYAELGWNTTASFDRQGEGTAAFLQRAGGSAPHVFVGDLNVWEGVATCGATPENGGLSYLRGEGYIDAWPAIHGTAEGFTGMTNRVGCGVPEGYTWKRIDYAWSPGNFPPVSIDRWAMETPGDGAPSDHYGIVAEYPWPGRSGPTPSSEIVLYASRATRIRGNWAVTSDAQAAGAARLWNPDRGAAKLASPLAAPADYAELTFNADAARAYRLWVRGVAERNYWGNDSAFVQFSGSVDASGTPRYRIGTTDAVSVNLEDCSGCGLAGWGWQDNGYGAGVLGPPVYFASSGPQTLRIQAREDGFSIDQIVLSSQTYLTAAPGSLKLDATILPETLTASAYAEVHLVASGATALAGAWRSVADPTAAGGTAVTHPDAGAAKLAAPLAAPVNYVEFRFNAEAGRAYRLWLRGRADRDYWGNDSVFVQFTNTVDSAGAPVFRIGSTSATSVNLEDCSGCGLSGWGWQDNGYGVGVLGPPITFSTTGPQTIRIQTREDGLRIDQILLSSEMYFTKAPGTLKGDTTILP